MGCRLRDTDYVETQRISTFHRIVLGILHKNLKYELEVLTAEINASVSHDRTMLCWANFHSDLRAVKTLLTFGADANLADTNGYTPLHFASSTDI